MHGLNFEYFDNVWSNSCIDFKARKPKTLRGEGRKSATTRHLVGAGQLFYTITCCEHLWHH